jgi:hypothetical protein
MGYIFIHNETGYDLSPLMLDQIKSEAIEHFGDRVAAIRLQLDIERHAFNTRTSEVRFAFSPFDFGFSEVNVNADKGGAFHNDMESRGDNSNDLILSDYVDEEDEAEFAMLDGSLDVPEGDNESVFQEFDADYFAIETDDSGSFPPDNTELDHYQR